MEKKINMPKLAPEMESGVLCAWLKEEGDTVAAGEPLFEIETNKVVNQVEATVSGVLKKQLAEEGDTVCVDTEMCIRDSFNCVMRRAFRRSFILIFASTS